MPAIQTAVGNWAWITSLKTWTVFAASCTLETKARMPFPFSMRCNDGDEQTVTMARGKQQRLHLAVNSKCSECGTPSMSLCEPLALYILATVHLQWRFHPTVRICIGHSAFTVAIPSYCPKECFVTRSESRWQRQVDRQQMTSA